MIKRNPLRFTLGLLLLFFLAAVSVGPVAYQEFLQQETIALLNSGPVRVKAQGMRLALTSLEAEQVSVFIPNIFTELSATQLKAEISPLAILKLKLLAHGRAVMLGGSSDIQFERPFLSDRTTINFAVDQLNLAELPQFNAFGVESGMLSSKSDALVLLPNKLPSGQAVLALTNFDKPTATTIRGKLVGLNNDIPLPKISNLNVHTNLQFGEDRIVLENFDSDSSLGTVSGRLAFFFDGLMAFKNLEIDLRCALSDEGAELFNIARQFLQTEQERENMKEFLKHKAWSISVRGKSPPRFTFKALTE